MVSALTSVDLRWFALVCVDFRHGHIAFSFAQKLPGHRAGLVRSEAARIFVRFHGGDQALAEQVIHNRERQEQLAKANPQHPARAFGLAVEADSAPVDPNQLQKACADVVARTLTTSRSGRARVPGAQVGGG